MTTLILFTIILSLWMVATCYPEPIDWGTVEYDVARVNSYDASPERMGSPKPVPQPAYQAALRNLSLQASNLALQNGALACDPQCQSNQYNALFLLFDAWNGPAWTDRENWLRPDVPLCRWKGVLCCLPDHMGLPQAGDCTNGDTITGLFLKSNNISGSLEDVPWASFAATLRVLVLDGNDLTGSPGALQPLSRLVYLSMASNRLNGPISALAPEPAPDQAQQAGAPSADNGLGLLELVSLLLPANQLTGSLPISLLQHPTLQYMDLSDNSLVGSVPSELFTGPSSLRSVRLYGNQLSGSLPDLTPMDVIIDDLTYLDLSSNHLSGTLPTYLSSRAKLTHLDMSHNLVVGPVAPLLRAAVSLYHIALGNNSLNGTVPTDILDGTQMQYLDLSLNSLSGTLPATMGLHLATLLLGGNENLTGELPHGLGSLTSLDISSTRMQAILPGAAGLPSYLTLSNSIQTSGGDSDPGVPLCPVAMLQGHQPAVVSPYYWQYGGCTCVDGYLAVYFAENSSSSSSTMAKSSGNGGSKESGSSSGGRVVGMLCKAHQPSPAMGGGPARFPWWAALMLAVGGLVLAAALLVVARRLTPSMERYRAIMGRRAPPGTNRKGRSCMVTLVLTDVEGSTELWEWDTDVMAAAIELHDHTLRFNLSKWQGYEVQTEGDAFLVAFHEPADALGWCITSQLLLLNADWDPELFRHPKAAIETIDSLQVTESRQLSLYTAACNNSDNKNQSQQLPPLSMLIQCHPHLLPYAQQQNQRQQQHHVMVGAATPPQMVSPWLLSPPLQVPSPGTALHQQRNQHQQISQQLPQHAIQLQQLLLQHQVQQQQVQQQQVQQQLSRGGGVNRAADSAFLVQPSSGSLTALRQTGIVVIGEQAASTMGTDYSNEQQIALSVGDGGGVTTLPLPLRAAVVATSLFSTAVFSGSAEDGASGAAAAVATPATATASSTVAAADAGSDALLPTRVPLSFVERAPPTRTPLDPKPGPTFPSAHDPLLASTYTSSAAGGTAAVTTSGATTRMLQPATTAGAAAAAATTADVDPQKPSDAWSRYTRVGVLYRGLRVRMGVATGMTDSIWTDGRMEYYGEVRRRLQAVADIPQGGQILMDASTFNAAQSNLTALSIQVQQLLRNDKHRSEGHFHSGKVAAVSGLPSCLLSTSRGGPRASLEVRSCRSGLSRHPLDLAAAPEPLTDVDKRGIMSPVYDSASGGGAGTGVINLGGVSGDGAAMELWSATAAAAVVAAAQDSPKWRNVEVGAGGGGGSGGVVVGAGGSNKLRGMLGLPGRQTSRQGQIAMSSAAGGPSAIVSGGGSGGSCSAVLGSRPASSLSRFTNIVQAPAGTPTPGGLSAPPPWSRCNINTLTRYPPYQQQQQQQQHQYTQQPLLPQLLASRLAGLSATDTAATATTGGTASTDSASASVASVTMAGGLEMPPTQVNANSAAPIVFCGVDGGGGGGDLLTTGSISLKDSGTRLIDTQGGAGGGGAGGSIHEGGIFSSIGRSNANGGGGGGGVGVLTDSQVNGRTLLGASSGGGGGSGAGVAGASCSFSEQDVTLPMGLYWEAQRSSRPRDLPLANLSSNGARPTMACPSEGPGATGAHYLSQLLGGGGGAATAAAGPPSNHAAAVPSTAVASLRRSGTAVAVGVMAMGVFELQAGSSVEYISLTQVLVPGLEERARLSRPLDDSRQLTPGYLDAPAATAAPLGAQQRSRGMSSGGQQGGYGGGGGGGGGGTGASTASGMLVRQLCFRPPPLPPVAVVFCSMERYPEMVAVSRDLSYDVLSVYNDCVRRSLLACGGYECQEQEGHFMVAFSEAGCALEWCLILQEIVMEVPWTPSMLCLPGMQELLHPLTGAVLFRGPRVKAGLYAGVPTRVGPHPTTGRADYYGPLVNRAARFCHAAAQGGQVIVARSLLEDILRGDLGLQDAAFMGQQVQPQQVQPQILDALPTATQPPPLTVGGPPPESLPLQLVAYVDNSCVNAPRWRMPADAAKRGVGDGSSAAAAARGSPEWDDGGGFELVVCADQVQPSNRSLLMTTQSSRRRLSLWPRPHNAMGNRCGSGGGGSGGGRSVGEGGQAAASAAGDAAAVTVHEDTSKHGRSRRQPTHGTSRRRLLSQWLSFTNVGNDISGGRGGAVTGTGAHRLGSFIFRVGSQPQLRESSLRAAAATSVTRSTSSSTCQPTIGTVAVTVLQQTSSPQRLLPTRAISMSSTERLSPAGRVGGGVVRVTGTTASAAAAAGSDSLVVEEVGLAELAAYDINPASVPASMRGMVLAAAMLVGSRPAATAAAAAAVVSNSRANGGPSNAQTSLQLHQHQHHHNHHNHRSHQRPTSSQDQLSHQDQHQHQRQQQPNQQQQQSEHQQLHARPITTPHHLGEVLTSRLQGGATAGGASQKLPGLRSGRARRLSAAAWDSMPNTLPTLPEDCIPRRTGLLRWLWAHELLVKDLGLFRFKGVAGSHHLVSVSTAATSERRAGPKLHTAKGERVEAGRGPLYRVVLKPADPSLANNIARLGAHNIKFEDFGDHPPVPASVPMAVGAGGEEEADEEEGMQQEDAMEPDSEPDLGRRDDEEVDCEEVVVAAAKTSRPRPSTRTPVHPLDPLGPAIPSSPRDRVCM